MSTIDENNVRNVAEEAAKIAGSFLKLMAFDKLRVFNVEETKKATGNFISVFDKEVERLIRNTINMYYPDSIIYTDANKNEVLVEAKKNEIIWFVDPLDGSKAFLKGQFAFVCLSLAAWDKEGLVAGAIYNPFTEMLYTASRNSECFLNSEILPKPKPVLRNKARILIDFSHEISENIKLGLITSVLRNELGRILRFDGSIAQHLALIAQGTLDGAVIWGSGSKGAYWDLAAALLLLDRQGLVVTNLDGKKILPSDSSFDQLIIAEPTLQKELLEWVPIIREFKFVSDESAKKKRFFGLFDRFN
ncbi:MAG: Inositol-1-monophosphatase [Candidatus Heimdallarchaeota archaeon LC_3]|nr:MAG: Inositol-1-monophosphatase [Candidatus Heimdallarchaeota archaeon LC_3]